MDIIEQYGGATKREKEIVNILSKKYPELVEKKLVTKSGRFMKNKEEEARKIY